MISYFFEVKKVDDKKSAYFPILRKIFDVESGLSGQMRKIISFYLSTLNPTNIATLAT